MNDQRHREVHDSIVRQLEGECGSLSPHERVVWLSDHIVAYVGTFCNLVAATDAPIDSFMDIELFTTIGIASAVVDTELAKGKPPATVLVKWKQFRTTLQDLTSAPSSEQAQRLRAAFLQWHLLVSKTPW